MALSNETNMAEVKTPGWQNIYDLYVATSQKNAPLFSLPDGRIITTQNRRKDQTSIDIVGRAGCVAIMDTEIDQKACFQWIHSNIFNNSGKPANGRDYGAQNLSEQDCINVAHTIPVPYMEANELGEGDPWGMPYQAPQKSWFYDERKRQYANAGKPYRNYGTYGGFENFNGDPWIYKTGGNASVLPNSDQAPFKRYIQSVQGARSSCDYFALFESKGVGAVIKNYADTPDFAPDYYRKKFAAEVMGKGMGRTGGIGPGLLAYLDWANIEGLGSESGDLHLGFNYERTKPNGSVATHSESFTPHPQVDYGWLLGCNFMIGMCLTDGCIPFDERSPIWGTDPNSDDYPDIPQSWHNVGFEAAYRYSQCDRTAGQPWQQCRYRFANSEAWIEPMTDGTTTLEHASAFTGPYGRGRRGRPDALFRVKGNAIDVAAFDASQGKNKSDTIILQPVPNKEISVNLRGLTLRQFRESI